MASTPTVVRLALAGFLAGALLGVATSGFADPMRLRLESVGTGVGVVITDNGAGDMDPTLGSITALSSLGAPFLVSIALGTSTPPLPGGGSELNLTGVVVAQGAGTVRFFLENDDYTYGTTVNALVGGALTGGTGTSITLQSWLNPDNLVPDLGPDVSPPAVLGAIGAIPAGSIGLFSPAVFGPGAFSASGSEPFSAAGAYSLFASGIITFTSSGGSASFSDSQSVPAPQPGTVVLLGAGLIGLAVLPLVARLPGRQRRA